MQKTKYYTDTKTPVKAGMQFKTANNKIKTIGFDVYRHYFDTPEKDCLIHSERIKRILKY